MKTKLEKFTIIKVWKTFLELNYCGKRVFLSIDARLARTFYAGQVLKIARPEKLNK